MLGRGPQYRPDDPDIIAFDESPADNRPMVYGLRPPEVASENSLPMFLSEYAEEAQPAEFITPLRKKRRASISSQILAGVCGAAALAVLYALISSDAARDTFLSVEASVAAVLPASSAAAQRDASQLAASNRQPPAANDNQMPAVPAVKMAAVSPSREKITAAYRNALQGNVPAPLAPAATEPDPVTPVEAPPPRLDPGEVAAALTRAESLIASGDVAAARLVLRRPAEAADARAAMRLAETYDPAFLVRLSVHGIVPDIAMARSWYEKAKRFGAADAAPRLEALASR